MDAAQFAIHARAEDTYWWFRARRYILHQVLAAIFTDQKAGRILDIGAGTGANAASFAQSYPVSGIDVSQFAIQLARKRFPHVEFHCGQITAFPELLQQADVVTLLDVMEHVPDDVLLLSQVLSMVRPGTHIVITVPAEVELWSPHDEALGHYRRYSPERLRQAWENLPVTCMTLTPFNSRLYWPIRLMRLKNRLQGKSLGGQENDLVPLPSPVNRFLEWIFRWESKRIVRCLKSKGTPHRRGVRLLAVLKRNEGEIIPHHRSDSIPPDQFDPLKGKSQGL